MGRMVAVCRRLVADVALVVAALTGVMARQKLPDPSDLAAGAACVEMPLGRGRHLSAVDAAYS